MGGDDYQPELIVSVGSVTTIYSNNMTEKQNSTPGPNFEFNAKIPGKMSGSPILVGGGILTKGVVSRSWQDENHASGCMIAPMIEFAINGKEKPARFDERRRRRNCSNYGGNFSAIDKYLSSSNSMGCCFWPPWQSSIAAAGISRGFSGGHKSHNAIESEEMK